MDPKLIERTYATHEAFRRLGFQSEEIFVGVGNTDDAFVQLQHGGKTFNVIVGKIGDLSQEEYYAKWTAFVGSLAHLPESELQRIWSEWLARNSTADFITSLVAKGIDIPSVPKALGDYEALMKSLASHQS